MFDKTDIRAAVEAGAISDEGAKRFEAFLKARNDPERMLDPENLRFLSNFNDVFLTIGIVVLMTGMAFLSAISVTNVLGLSAMAEPQSIAEGRALADAIRLAIVLSPICGRRRLLLPSMALSAAIVGATSLSAAGLASLFISEYALVSAIDRGGFNPFDFLSGMTYAGFGAAVIASGAIFLRFRLPFSLFLMAGAIAGLFYTALLQAAGAAGVSLMAAGAVTLGVGVGTFIAAIVFDARDPTRTTRNADHAFWLHMAAAPQIIIGVRAMVLASGFDEASSAYAAVMLAVLALFGLLSLALNRRALIVSGLVTFAAALFVLVSNSGWSGLNALMFTALIVGASIVLLGGGWRTARRLILKGLPRGGMTDRIFPPEPV